MELGELIDACIQKKQGDKEFALFYLDPGWKALIGCKFGGMMLGESPGEFEAEGETREAAVAALLAKIEEQV